MFSSVKLRTVFNPRKIILVTIMWTKKKIFLMSGALLMILFIAIIARYFFAFLLLPAENQSVAFLEQCYHSGGALWTGHTNTCGHNLCWGGVGVQMCGYGERIISECDCGPGRCWDGVASTCTDTLEFEKIHEDADWLTYESAQVADVLTPYSSSTSFLDYPPRRYRGRIISGSAITDAPERSRTEPHCLNPFYFADDSGRIHVQNSYSAYAQFGEVEIIGGIIDPTCTTACDCDATLLIIDIRRTDSGR